MSADSQYFLKLSSIDLLNWVIKQFAEEKNNLNLPLLSFYCNKKVGEETIDNVVDWLKVGLQVHEYRKVLEIEDVYSAEYDEMNLRTLAIRRTRGRIDHPLLSPKVVKKWIDRKFDMDMKVASETFKHLKSSMELGSLSEQGLAILRKYRRMKDAFKLAQYLVEVGAMDNDDEMIERQRICEQVF